MLNFKCKMCGGDLEIGENTTVCECSYCGSKQTIPTADNEKKIKLFDRANRLRFNCEFDKAATVYESIMAEFPEEAEGYWGNLLCTYGIEYVDDPATGNKIPTCHRSSFTCFLDEEDFEQVMENADVVARGVYREQAKQIEQIRKSIIEVSGYEAPYDIFICYKETDETGDRTTDSVIAQDVYDALTAKGYRVFFSRISLEDKLGTEYEPYIFAALNSAKIMLAFGTSYDYYNAVWVKNEWSRYLKLMAADKEKHLIPCYKDIDAYDMPKEFRSLQGQDMGKVGAVQDLIRGIDKILSKGQKEGEQSSAQQVVQTTTGVTSSSLIKRGNMALEDHEWEKADNFFEEALNLEPECAEAYLGKMLARDKQDSFDAWVLMQKAKYAGTPTTERMAACREDTEHISKMVEEMAIAGYLEEDTIRNEYESDLGYDAIAPCRKIQKKRQLGELAADRLLNRVKQYATGSLKTQLDNGLDSINVELDNRIAEAREQDEESVSKVKSAYINTIGIADQKIRKLNAEIQNKREFEYQFNINLMKQAKDADGYQKAMAGFSSMNGYRDTTNLATKCQEEINQLQIEQKQKEENKRRRKKKIIISIIGGAMLVVFAIILYFNVLKPYQKYKKAVSLKSNGEYNEAIDIFEELNDYRDSDDQILDCKYSQAVLLMEKGKNSQAVPIFVELSGFKDSDKLKIQCECNQFSTVYIGEEILFGSYEQDNNLNNGKEEIEWIVIGKYGQNKVLLLSKYALDCRPYNRTEANATWDMCSLRTWLNEVFLDEAFDQKQVACVSTTYNLASEDKIFLLTTDSAEKYLESDNRQCELTAYARVHGNDESLHAWYWLQSNGWNLYHAAFIDRTGEIKEVGATVNKVGGVRPAMWVEISE